MFDFIYLTDHSSLHFTPSVWFSPSFPHLSLSSSAFIPLNCPFTSLLFIYLHISSLTPPPPHCSFFFPFIFLHFFHISAFPSFFNPVITLPVSVFLHLSFPDPLFFCLNRYIFALTSPYRFSSSVYFTPQPPQVTLLITLFLSVSPPQLVLFGKSNGVRWCHVWRTRVATC